MGARTTLLRARSPKLAALAAGVALLLLPTSTARLPAPEPGAEPGGRGGGVRAAQLAEPPPRRSAKHLVARAATALAAIDDRLLEAASGRRRPAPGEPGPRRPRRRLAQRELALLEAAGILRREGAPREIAGVRHTRLQAVKQGLPVLNRRGRVHERDGELLGATGGFEFPPLAHGGFEIGEERALAIAQQAVDLRLERASPQVEQGWFARPGETVPAWRVTLPAWDPIGTWEVTLDARGGEVLQAVNLVRSVDGLGRVFEKNPRESKAPEDVVLTHLDGSGTLSGSYVRVFDLRAVEARHPGLQFVYPRDDPRFVQTSVYRGLTEAADLAVEHGFEGFEEPVVAFTNLADFQTGGEYNNAFYDPSIPAFVFGNGDGVITSNLGTDLDVPAHEMGHHLFQVLVDPLFSAEVDAVLAMNEGVADTFSFLIGGDKDIGEAVIPGRRFLRTLKGRARYPESREVDPHSTGRIYGAANWDLKTRMKTDVFTRVLLAGLPFLPPDAEEEDYPEAMLQGDQVVTGGKFARQIRSVFKARGFENVDPEGFQGRIMDGLPESGFLANRDFHVWVFVEIPDATEFRVELTGTGDADLLVANADGDPRDDSTFLVSQRFGPNESIVIDRGTQPSVDDTDVWIVLVADYPLDRGPSSYTVTVTADVTPDQVFLDGDPVVGEILDTAEIDFLAFSGTEGQYVRAEVEALDPSLDPLVVIATEELDVLAFDDDSLGNRDSLIQGVRLPATGRYLAAVLSPIADVDPQVGTGRYELRLLTCDNVGTDTDGDGASDVCDDDDDDDGFIDSRDDGPLEPLVCADVDFDGCEDCSSGAFDPLNDGPDAELDSECDVGDPDDDNDGCDDELDPEPRVPSLDPDLDFQGEDCDNCAAVPNPMQEDADLDGVGDACVTCARVLWTDPPQPSPDQNPLKSRIALTNLHLPGRQGLAATGRFNPAVAPELLDPGTHGVHVRLADADGPLYDLSIPGGPVGSSPCDPRDGWKTTEKRNGERLWKYVNRSGALPPLCAPGSARGIHLIDVADKTPTPMAAFAYSLKARNDTLPRPAADPVRFLHLDLALGAQPAVGEASPEGAAGQCAQSVLWLDGPSSSCLARRRAGELVAITCKGL